MLVLTRKVGERVRIGSDVMLVVLEIDHGQVRVGVEAPRSISVHREEIYKALAEANRSAAEADWAGEGPGATGEAERAFSPGDPTS